MAACSRIGEAMEKPNWQSISFMPQLSIMINGVLEAAIETYEPVRQIKVHDDYTIKRIFEVTGSQIEDEWLYDNQLERWLKLKNIKPDQSLEIKNLQNKMKELKKVNRKIIEIAEKHKDKTIEKVMSKSNAELSLDFLLGKL